MVTTGMRVFSSAKSRIPEFESAALPHLNDIFRTAVGLLGNRTEGEDLAQEVYLHAWKSFHRFEPGTNCRAWLFKILFHRLHHYRKKWFRLRLTRQGDEIIEETLRYEPPVPERLADKDVLAALQKIPKDFREVVLLTDVEDFSYKEAAATLCIPVGTVMSRLSRGRKLLRAELAEVAKSFGLNQGEDAAGGHS